MCLDIEFYSALQLIDDYFPDTTHDGEFHFDPDMGVHFMALGHNRYPVITLEDGIRADIKKALDGFKDRFSATAGK